MNKFYLLASFIVAVTTGARCQNSSSASVTSRATIVEPIKIQKTLDLDFGNVIASLTPGRVILSPDGTRLAQGVTISNAVPGQVNPAEAIVSHGELTYSIILPESFTLYNQENPNQMLMINNFTVEPEPTASGEGIEIIKIGATLNLEANQGPGFYTNAAGFNVTVTYN